MTLDLGGRFEIHESEPRTDLDTGTAKAFKATAKGSSDSDLAGFLQSHQFAHDLARLEPFVLLTIDGLASLLDQDVVTLPNGHRRLATIWRLPSGGRILRSLDEAFEPLGEKFLIDGFIRSVLPALRDLDLHRQPHREIRPTNLFYRSSGRGDGLILGPFGLGPPAYDQPGWLEPVESAVTDPDARGRGRIADDLFSLGATLVFLALGGSSLRRMDQQTLLHRRFNQGSFEVLTDGRRLPADLADVARGLLADNVKERWTLKDLELWLDGRSPTIHRKGAAKAGRPFVVNGRSINTPRGLAEALASNWDIGVATLRSAEFDEWLRRAGSDGVVSDKAAKRVRELIASGKGEALQDSTISLSCLAFDPAGPLRYRSIAAMPEGVADALAATLAKPKPPERRRNDFVDLIRSGGIKRWISAQLDASREAFAFSVIAEKLRDVAISREVAFGLERCLYELSPHVHCLSPLLIEHVVLGIADVLPTLDRLPAVSIQPTLMADRHIVGFIACRCPQMSPTLLRSLEEKVGSLSHLVATARILAQIQVSSGNGPVVNLSTRWAELLKAAVLESVRRKDLRKRLVAEIDRAAPFGRMDSLVHPLADAALLDRENKGFLAAAAEHSRNRQAIAALEDELSDTSRRAKDLGPQIASSVSLACALVTVVILILRQLAV
jgi:hypothetical protein